MTLIVVRRTALLVVTRLEAANLKLSHKNVKKDNNR